MFAARVLILIALILAEVIAVAPIATADEVTTFYTTASAAINLTNVTDITQQANTYQVELIGSLQGGAALYDQIFAVSANDPSFQTAITQVNSLLASNGAVSTTGPTLVSSSQSTSSSTSTIQTGQSSQVYGNTATFIGPQTVFIGDFGTCQGYAIGTNYQGLSGCSLSGQPLSIPAGGVDTNTLYVVETTTDQTVTTINTTLTTQVYDITGNLGTTSVPEPSALALLGLGLGIVGCLAKSFRL